MSLRIGTIRFRVHPLLPLVWGAAWLLGRGSSLLPALLAFLLHEGGHLAAAKALGLPLEEMELTPFGGVLVMGEAEAQNAAAHFWTAFAGPAFSALGCFLAAWAYRRGTVPFPFAGAFFRANLTLLLINLLPALPLDGGQMLRSLMQKRLPYSAVTRALTALAWAAGFFLCLCSVLFAWRGSLVFAPAFAGLYLIYASAIERRQSAARYVTALIGRRQRIDGRQAVPVEAVAVGPNATPNQLLRQLHPGKYHVILIVSPDGMGWQGTMEERAFCEAVLSHGNEPMGRLMEKRRPQ